MGMRGYARQITLDEVTKIQRDPGGIKKLLRRGYSWEDAIRDRIEGNASPQRDTMEAAYARSMEIRQAVMAERPEGGPFTPDEIKRITQPLSDTGAEGGDENLFDLEKSWHVLHYLLTGTVTPVNTPLGNAILGGQEIGPDLGYGPARLLSPDKVRKTAEALGKLSQNDLAQHADFKVMKAADIYACGRQSDLTLAQDYLDPFKKFYREAAKKGNAMLFYVK